MSNVPKPKRGEIWFGRLPSDPPGKAPRPVVVISKDSRNLNDRAETVMVVPFTTTLKEAPSRIALSPGETGLSEPSMLVADGVTTVRKETLMPSRFPLRQLTEQRLRQIAVGIILGMGFQEDLFHKN